MIKTEKNNVICTIFTGRPGSGKTTHMLHEITRQPGRYFLVAPRVELIEEHHAWLQRLLGAASPVVLLTIHSEQKVKGTIERRVSDALRKHAKDHHVVILATHDALLTVDPDDVEGWHVRIDELPPSIVSGCAKVGASWTALNSAYTLGSTYGQWREVSHREGATLPTHGQIRTDVGKNLAPFHRLARSRRVLFVDVAAWPDLALKNRTLNWWSIWSPAILEGCASMKITAAAFEGSLFKAAIEWLSGVTFVVQTIGARRSPAHQPAISIAYYTQHRGSTTWWETDEGSRCLVEISRHLERTGFDGYWSSNDSVRAYFRHRFGEYCAPKQAGSNALHHHTSCAMIYSCKAQDSDRTIIDLLGLDVDAILHAREQEDLWQFCLRGQIRVSSYIGTYAVHVYSRDQAEELLRRFEEAGYTSVEIVAVDDAGVMDVNRPVRKGEQNPNVDARASAADVKARRLRQDRVRKSAERGADRADRIAKGTYRPRGRPPLSNKIAGGKS